MIDGRHPHDLLESALRRLHDAADVLAAISVASRLLVEQIDALEGDIIALTKMATDGEKP
jgi:hypothetical protein